MKYCNQYETKPNMNPYHLYPDNLYNYNTSDIIDTSLICSVCNNTKSKILKIFPEDIHNLCLNCLIQTYFLYKICFNFNRDKNSQKLFFKPKDIKHYLDQYLIGQKKAKKIISVKRDTKT